MRYKTPKLPPAGEPWYLEGPDGFKDGLFRAEDVVPSELEGRPSVIVGGSPRVLRIKRQRGNRLVMEDGTYHILMDPAAANRDNWPVAPV